MKAIGDVCGYLVMPTAAGGRLQLHTIELQIKVE